MIKQSDILGAWQLESWTIGYSDRDDFTNPFGDEPSGLLMYTSDGWMSAAICAPDRTPLPEDIPYMKLPEAVKSEAFSSYFHYAGRFRIVDGDVIHYVTHSLNPNMVGTEQLRHAELDGHTLVLSGQDTIGEIQRFHSLVWHKIPDLATEIPVEAG